jgi:hypothetical protein
MVGFLNPAPDPRHPTGKRHSDGPVSLIFGGEGLMFEGIPETPPEQQPALARAAATDGAAGLSRPAATCPTPQFTPASGENFCNTPGCLVTFKGYQWWTNYNYFDPGSGYWNANNRWSPRNVELKEDGLHLSVRQQQTPDQSGNCCITAWTSAEAVTALNPDGSLAKLGFGTYLVSAKVLTASSWNAMDPNVAFGVFTYERDGTGDTNNPNREIDLAEVSRWGRRDNETCRIKPDALCEGNSQYALQVWWAGRDDARHELPNVKRYTIPDAQNDITLVMIWEAANTPVTFRQYNGRHTLATIAGATPSFEWITPPGGGNAGNRNPWIPGDGCQQFHLNFWQGNATDPKPEPGINPPPASPQEIVITEFEYKPL